MEWRDRGIVLAARPHGEGGAVVQALTATRGRHAGMVKGVRRLGAALQPGSEVTLEWRGRLAEHLGNYAIEPVRVHAAGPLEDAPRLAALQAACALCEILPEREPHPAIHDGLIAFFSLLDSELWSAAYVRWELGFLADLGYGLELTRCAAGGDHDRLSHVSPRTGRAVSLSAAEPYKDRLLPLPGFLVGQGGADKGAVLEGLRLTGHFLERWVFGQANRPVPTARIRLVETLGRQALQSDSLDRRNSGESVDSE